MERFCLTIVLRTLALQSSTCPRATCFAVPLPWEIWGQVSLVGGRIWVRSEEIYVPSHTSNHIRSPVQGEQAMTGAGARAGAGAGARARG